MGGEFDEFGLGGDGLEVVMRQTQHVRMAVDLRVQLLRQCDFGESDGGGGGLEGELLAQAVVALVEAVGGEQVGHRDGLVELLLAQRQDDVLRDFGARTDDQQTHGSRWITIWITRP